MTILIAYGFEFSNSIPFIISQNICQSILNGNPIYCSHILRETDICDVIDCIQYINNHHRKELQSIHRKHKRLIQFVEHLSCNVCKFVGRLTWQIVYQHSIYKPTKSFVRQRPPSPVRFSLVNPETEEYIHDISLK